MPATATARARETREPFPLPVPKLIGLPATLTRVRAEYTEMPGLCLTLRQAERLFGLDRDRCADVLDALVDVGFLKRLPEGYVRAA